MQLKLFKYEGAGNDFVAIDGRGIQLPAGTELCAFVRALCNRRLGVGGDGVLIIRDSDSKTTDFRMSYYNSDGSEGEMCGNGARCIASFAHLVGAAGQDMTFDTSAGRYHAVLNGAGVTLSFPEVPSLPLTRTLHALGRDWDTDFIEVGVPHLVVWVDEIDRLDVNVYGRALRLHEALAPRGANVNFTQRSASGPHDIDVRTYERGVEEETLACGTGSVAASISHAVRSGKSGKCEIRALPTGKQALTIGFDLKADGAKNVTLAGPARLVFTTVVDWDSEKRQLRST